MLDVTFLNKCLFKESYSKETLSKCVTFFATVVSFMLHIHLRFLILLMQIVCEEFSGFLL